MVLCFNCQHHTKELLDRLLESGEYRDYSEAISMAVLNLATLQKEVGDKGALVLGDPAPSHRAGSAGPQRDAAEYQPSNQSPTKMTLLELAKMRKPPESFPRPLDDIWSDGREVPVDRWILGQYNRLLPAKVSCRVLAHRLPPWLPLGAIESTAVSVAAQATLFAEQLRTFDARLGLDRDQALSTAFPSNGETEQKSLLRYANQFVMSMTKDRQLSGLLADLKLITLTRGDESLLALTEVGWQFAAFPNPVLDEFPPTDSRRFSAEELALLTHHIATTVPVENFAYRAILESISEGASTPDLLDVALQRFVSSEKRNQLSKAFLSSQRSGVISRMADLELVRRERDGIRVKYCLTQEGREYLNGKETAVA
jgi:hypothetical protein